MREGKLNLMRDLARQRYVDLALSPMKNDLEIRDRIAEQDLVLSIMCSYYESPRSVWRHLKADPGLTIFLGIREGLFMLASGTRLGLRKYLIFK